MQSVSPTEPTAFPEFPAFSEEKYHEITAGVLRDMIRRVAFAVSSAEHSKFGATVGVLWEIDGENISLVATDGRRLALKVELDLLYRVAKADSLGRRKEGAPPPDADAQEWFIERAKALAVSREGPKPLLLGRHLLEMGLTPGPRIGEIADQVYQRQLDGDVRTLDEAIAAARKILGK